MGITHNVTRDPVLLLSIGVCLHVVRGVAVIPPAGIGKRAGVKVIRPVK